MNDRIADLHQDMIAWRHDLHAHPELGFQEHRTSDFVAAKLAEFGVEVHRGRAINGARPKSHGAGRQDAPQCGGGVCSRGQDG